MKACGPADEKLESPKGGSGFQKLATKAATRIQTAKMGKKKLAVK